MGRGRHSLAERTDAFASVMGVGRGRAGLRALAANLDSAASRSELKRLVADVRGDRTTETIDLLRASWDGSETGVLGGLAETLTRHSVEQASAEAADATREFLQTLNFRNHFCDHVVVDKGVGVLHLCAQPDRQRRVGDSITLACWRRLGADEWRVAERGDWLVSAASERCPVCAREADSYEETGEGMNYPVLSDEHAAEIAGKAEYLFFEQLPGELEVNAGAPRELAFSAHLAYRRALQDMLAREFAASGEWPFCDGILDVGTYNALVAETGRRKFAGILSEHDWAELLGGEFYRALPIPGIELAPMLKPSLQARVAAGVRGRLAGHPVIGF